ncbi:MFS transporter [Alkalicoccus daliensis]|uniref:Predicted arabinose efflux permease, MFS family n=1 Tax=Alkalicoccus daliensis TaxID=745820 RepID=A0A1H0D838_9BACI|nr:MFS transporter [Alkalicoccus daliensis]SDN66249.1 Predicted arabinose efflux permease, MFS family [Alkalicoccus daliensis]
MWKIVFPGIAMIGITYAFARYSFGLFLPEISKTLQLTESQAGYVGFAAYAAYTLALLSSPLLIKHFSARKAVLLSGLTAMAGMLGMAGAQGFITLFISAFVAGTGSGWISPAFSQVAAASFSRQQQEKGNTWINTGTSFGLVFTGVVAVIFPEHWRWSYVMFAVLAFLVYQWNAAIVEEKRVPAVKKTQRVPLRKLLLQARWMISASAGIGFISAVYWTFSRSYLTIVHGMSSHESIMFWMVMGSAGIIGGIAGGVIRFLGLHRSYQWGTLTLTISLIALTVPSFPSIYISGILFGISFIFMTGLFIVWGTRQFPSFPSLGVSISFFSLGMGQAAGSLAAGRLIESFSYPAAFILFSIAGCFLLLMKTTILQNRR